MRARTMAGLLATGGLILGFAAGPAVADPKNGDVIPVACDNGKSYAFVVNGNGEFTPAHVAGSNTMFVPTSFGAFTGTVTDANGTVDIYEPPEFKGQSANGRKNLITCSFSFSGTEDGLTFDVRGTVSGFLTPSRR